MGKQQTNEQPRTTSRPLPKKTIIDSGTQKQDHFLQEDQWKNQPRWLSDSVEWWRGKTEFWWENRMLPIWNWLTTGFGSRSRGMRQQVHISWSTRRRALSTPRQGFAFTFTGGRMFSYFVRILTITAAVAAIVILIAAGSMRIATIVDKFSAPSNPLSNSNSTPANDSITIHNNLGGNATPPPSPQYSLGMWPSNFTPAPGQASSIFVKVAQQTTPLANITVTITYNGHSQSTTTNKDGIAAFNVSSTVPQMPVNIFGSATVNGQNLTASTFITPT